MTPNWASPLVIFILTCFFIITGGGVWLLLYAAKLFKKAETTGS